MSDRIRDERDPFWRSRDKRILDAHLAALWAASRATDIDAEIARRRRSDYLESCAAEARRLRIDLLEEIASTSIAVKDKWHRGLADITLTDYTAADQLEKLKTQVDFWTRLYESNPTGSTPDHPVRTSNPVLLRLELEDEQRRTRQRAVASEAAAIADSLDGLIDAVRRYDSARHG